jgi:hypothetical protein
MCSDGLAGHRLDDRCQIVAVVIPGSKIVSSNLHDRCRAVRQCRCLEAQIGLPLRLSKWEAG